MTLKIRIQVPTDAGQHEAKVRIGATEHILAPGETVEGFVYAGQDIVVSEVPVGTKAALADRDFPLGKACDRFDPTCESCQ